ncbi:hypothetical protein FSP39_020753 [Pinctada imbricata]|uniref:Methyltransferase domain-containing protein n=1 Tax=Pinctada imbricata TaxID=66713 RepID=A0AA88Y0D3_PINIB|nr:hypothetical protein FSP39_020753 [Pinctada imbricata]
MGKLDDGGWDICDDLAYRPGKNCLVYSFGINFDFSFDDAIVKKYGCEVHSFDPSMRRPDHKHGKNVMFHASGLSKDNQSSRGKLWKMRTLKQFLGELGHLNRTIDVLKIDIEEWEWLALPEMIKSGVMSQVRQFDVELHITLKTEPNKNKYFLGLSILKDLYDIGFRIFWTHRNLYCKFNSRVGSVARSGCHEVSFINVNFKPKS